MRKETKALLQKNNQQETLLFPDFQSVLNNMVTYLRSTRLPYSLQEQARQQIIQLFLAEQEKGASPDEVIGMDFKEYCDTLLEQSPRNNGHTRILCAVRYISMFLAVGTAILFLPDMISAPFTPNHSFTLQVGKLIFLFFLVTFSGCRCYSILMLRTSEPFSGLIYKQRKHETFYYIERFRAFLLPIFKYCRFLWKIRIPFFLSGKESGLR